MSPCRTTRSNGQESASQGVDRSRGIRMGQKVRPTGFRTGIMTDWLSKWYASKQHFSELLVEDHKIRTFIKRKYPREGVARIKIERTQEKVVVFIYAAKV